MGVLRGCSACTREDHRVRTARGDDDDDALEDADFADKVKNSRMYDT